MTAPQTPAPAALPSDPPSLPQPGRVQPPAGTRASDSAPPAGTTDEDRAAQRKQWASLQSSHNRGQRGGQYRRRAARVTLPRPGMIRRPPPGPPDDAA